MPFKSSRQEYTPVVHCTSPGANRVKKLESGLKEQWIGIDMNLKQQFKCKTDI